MTEDALTLAMLFLAITFSVLAGYMIRDITTQKTLMYCHDDSIKWMQADKELAPDGLAYGNYIVVWTKDRTITQTLETCTHEYAHNNLGLKDP